MKDHASPKQFKDDFIKFAPYFDNEEEQDCNEFIVLLLEALSLELNRVKVKPKYKELKFKDKDTDEMKSELASSHFKTIEDSFICDNF